MKLGLPQVIADMFVALCEFTVAILVVLFYKHSQSWSRSPFWLPGTNRPFHWTLGEFYHSARSLRLSPQSRARFSFFRRVGSTIGTACDCSPEAFMLTYASALQWFTIASFFGVGAYILAAVFPCPEPGPYRLYFSLALGGLTFGVPYLIVYFIPNWTEIWITLNSIDEQFRLTLGPMRQLEIYHGIVASWKQGGWLHASTPLAIIYAISLPDSFLLLSFSFFFVRSGCLFQRPCRYVFLYSLWQERTFIIPIIFM